MGPVGLSTPCNGESESDGSSNGSSNRSTDAKDQKIPSVFIPGSGKQIENMQWKDLTPLQIEDVRGSPVFLALRDLIMATTKIDPLVFDKPAMNMLGYLSPTKYAEDARLVAHIAGIFAAQAPCMWRQMAVANFVVPFMFFFGREDSTLDLQLQALPCLPEMMGDSVGNTVARVFFLSGHPLMKVMHRTLIQNKALTSKLMTADKPHGFYVLRWYYQYNTEWMESTCPNLSREICARHAQASARAASARAASARATSSPPNSNSNSHPRPPSAFTSSNKRRPTPTASTTESFTGRRTNSPGPTPQEIYRCDLERGRKAPLELSPQCLRTHEEIGEIMVADFICDEVTDRLGSWD